MQPSYARENILMQMQGDNMTAVHWVSKCRGGKEPRSGAPMRLLVCLEVGSGWCFDAVHVAGVDNSIADGISRWEPHYASRAPPNVADEDTVPVAKTSDS